MFISDDSGTTHRPAVLFLVDISELTCMQVNDSLLCCARRSCRPRAPAWCCAQRPATCLMNCTISPFSMVPELSLSNSRKHWSKSSSLKPAPSAMSESVSCTKRLVSYLSRKPLPSSSYLFQISSTHFAMTASISALLLAMVHLFCSLLKITNA